MSDIRDIFRRKVPKREVFVNFQNLHRDWLMVSVKRPTAEELEVLTSRGGIVTPDFGPRGRPYLPPQKQWVLTNFDALGLLREVRDLLNHWQQQALYDAERQYG